MSRSTRLLLPMVHTVAVCFHIEPARLIARLQPIASRCGMRLGGVVVTNNPEHSLAPPADDFEVMRGSNEHLDFSGYFEGFDRLVETRATAPSSNVLFLNDSLVVKHAASCIASRVLGLDALLGQLAVPAMAGKLDPYRSICLFNPWSGHAGYVSSYCFLLNASAQLAMRTLLKNAASDGVLTDLPLTDEAWGSGLPLAMRESIRAHLVYPDSPYLWKARGDEGLIRKKARCVYFESRLSGAIGSGGSLLPINSGPRSQAQIFLRETLARVANRFGGSRR